MEGMKKPTNSRVAPMCVTATVLLVAGCGGAPPAGFDGGPSVQPSPADGGGSDAGVHRSPTAGQTGSACSSNGACSQGTEPQCLTSADGVAGFSPGGYCASICTSAADCQSGDPCVGGIFSSGSQPLSICLEGCSTNADCRSGYNCAQFRGHDFCWPNCTSDNDCPDTTETCNVQTGTCSSGSSGEPDAGPGNDGGSSQPGYPGTRPSPPQVVSQRGPVLSAPVVVPVFFSNDDATTPGQVQTYLQKLANSSYWSQSLGEYGVGKFTVANAVTASSASSTSDQQIASWLQSEIASNKLPSPVTNETIYALHYPSSVTITLGGQPSCQTFGGYHADLQLNDGTLIAYAVLPRCSAQGQGLSSDLEVLTVSESHELAEAATDPYPSYNPAYAQVDDAYLYLDGIFGGSEIGDMCENDPQVYITPSDIGHSVQRLWSNRESSAGHDPCGPEPAGEVYFAAAPVLPDTIAFNYNGQTVNALGVNIRTGQSGTVTLDLFSEGSTGGPWTVSVQDVSAWSGGSPTMSFTLSSQTGQNGDHITLTIRPTTSGQGGQDFFIVTSTNAAQESHFTIGMVGGE
jgi:hypothetical protein